MQLYAAIGTHDALVFPVQVLTQVAALEHGGKRAILCCKLQLLVFDLGQPVTRVATLVQRGLCDVVLEA